jgi:hypothetical protein
MSDHHDTTPEHDRDPRQRESDDQGEDTGLLEETAPLPAPGGETATPAEGPDDPPNEGAVPSDPETQR